MPEDVHKPWSAIDRRDETEAASTIMHLLMAFQLPVIVWFASVMSLDDSVCAFFEKKDAYVADDGDNVITDFNICPDISLSFVRAYQGSEPGFARPKCRIPFTGGTCNFTAPYCSCSKRTFSLTVEINSSDCAQWYIHGDLENDGSLNKTVQICPNQYRTSQSTSTETDASTRLAVTDISTGFPRNPTHTDTSTIKTTLHQTTNGGEGQGDSLKAVSILGGVVGFVLLIVAVLAVCVGILFWKRGRSRRLPPPPPAPHNVRRAVHCGSQALSTHGHEYDEIPDDVDMNKSESSLASVHSLPVSDSSMSDDCLHHIACPSSDSSLPEDYLNPVASAWDVVTTIKEENSSSSSEAVMYAKERITFKKKYTKKITSVQVEPPVKMP
ncbi:hypothetical protein V1264_016927 [Littorina saxatilis]|uniref:Uncharacterized protein n=1 Tax=Littorina saxatilis TaxID=31220 RepID=A0AAN9BG78_9CAEN